MNRISQAAQPDAQVDQLESLISAVLLGEGRRARLKAVALTAGVADVRLRHALDPDHPQHLHPDELTATVAAIRQMRYAEAPALVDYLVDAIGGEPLPAATNGQIDDEMIAAAETCLTLLRRFRGPLRTLRLTPKHRNEALLALRQGRRLLAQAEAELRQNGRA